MSAATIVCGGCTQTWTALNACHCAACHRTFSTVRLFDTHRMGVSGTHSGSGGTNTRCRIPELLLDKSKSPVMVFRNGMWRRPDDGRFDDLDSDL